MNPASYVTPLTAATEAFSLRTIVSENAIYQHSIPCDRRDARGEKSYAAL